MGPRLFLWFTHSDLSTARLLYWGLADMALFLRAALGLGCSWVAGCRRLTGGHVGPGGGRGVIASVPRLFMKQVIFLAWSSVAPCSFCP